MYYSKYPIETNNIDVDEIMISRKISFDKKGLEYFKNTKIMKKLSHCV